jgi:uncharacterized protein (TIGR00299 family) protein
VSPRTVYFDLASGAGGDMLVAALVGAGRALGIDVATAVATAVSQLDLGCTLGFTDVRRGGVSAVHTDVTTSGGSYDAQRMRDAVERVSVPATAKLLALDVIDRLVAAEAAVHGVDPDHVVLHELGSADTPADAIACAVALHVLDVAAVTAAPAPMPRGWIDSTHGTLPVPAPAVAELLRGARVVGTDGAAELVTPTAAAILAAAGTVFGLMPAMTLEAVGTGAGSAERNVPNVCRAFLGTTAAPAGIAVEPVIQLDANIDDQTPEGVAHAIGRLLGAGAVDAWVTPIVMKKSRPAFQLSVLTRPDDEAAVVGVVFRETTTLGVRRRETTRFVADRDEIVVRAAGECVRVKVARVRGEVVGASPEFDDCVRAANASGTPLKQIYAEAAAAALEALAC